MKCPGQDTQYWKPDAVFDAKCPKCFIPVEFFKDDTSRKCPACSHRFVNPHMDFGCVAYCPHAEQCLGALGPEVSEIRENLMKDKISILAKKELGNDFTKISEMLRRMRYAQTIGVSLGVSMAPLLLASIVYDIDRPAGLLSQGQVNADLSKEVLSLIARQKEGQTPETDLEKALWDAVTLTQNDIKPDQLSAISFYTDTAKNEADQLQQGERS